MDTGAQLLSHLYLAQASLPSGATKSHGGSSHLNLLSANNPSQEYQAKAYLLSDYKSYSPENTNHHTRTVLGTRQKLFCYILALYPPSVGEF